MSNFKNIISDYKNYIKVITDFSELNSYVFHSSIFLNRLELILYNEQLSNEEKINNILLSYSDFKVTNLENNFNNGVEVKNEFES